MTSIVCSGWLYEVRVLFQRIRILNPEQCLRHGDYCERVVQLPTKMHAGVQFGLSRSELQQRVIVTS